MMKTRGTVAKSDGVILILSAPSGAGKTTLIKKLMRAFPELRLSVSYTTRETRPGEMPGQDYHFVGKKRFEEMRGRGEFAEWAKVHGSFYGTPRRPLEQNIRSGQDVLLDIDVQGSRSIKGRYRNAVSVFILPPSLRELERRLAHRKTDRKDIIRKRLENAKRELVEIHGYDYFVLNRRIRDAQDALKSILIAERHRISRVQSWKVLSPLVALRSRIKGHG